MSDRDRKMLRYGVSSGAIVVGLACAAVLTNSVGNTVATVLIGGGLLAFVIFLLRDMGLIDSSERPAPPQPSRNGSDPHHELPPSDPTGSERHGRHGRHGPRAVSVRRPDRMRGRRRRLR